MTRRRLAHLVCLCALPAAAESRLHVDQLAEATIREWKIPGLALAVVEDSKLVHQKGYGLRDVSKKLPVTPATVFGIGSITKSFTVLAMWTLAGENKLDWDHPVRDQMPGFRLKDTAASERATPRDLVTHRTGLPRHDAMWGGGGSPPSRHEIFQRLRYLEPSRDFRAAFQYNNLMYLTAGLLAEAVSGERWESLVERRLFAAVGMKAAKATMAEAARGEDYALPYGEQKGEWTPLVVENLAPSLDTAGPAGSIQASLEDMTRYLLLHIHGGKLDGKQVLEQRFLTAMQTPQMVIAPPATPGPYPGDQSYGMGLFVGNHRGRKAVWHTGTYGGHHALLWFLPAERFGVMVMINRVAREVPAILALTLADRHLGVDGTDWNRLNRESAQRQREAAERTREEFEKKRKEGTRPSHELKDYAGRYIHAAYGTVEVSLEGDVLRVKRNQRTTPLRHWHYDVFLLGQGQDAVRFLTGLEGDVEALLWRLEPAVDEIVFRKER